MPCSPRWVKGGHSLQQPISESKSSVRTFCKYVGISGLRRLTTALASLCLGSCISNRTSNLGSSRTCTDDHAVRNANIVDKNSEAIRIGLWLCPILKLDGDILADTSQVNVMDSVGGDSSVFSLGGILSW